MTNSSFAYQHTLNWLCHSIDVNNGQGSSAYYHLWKGWAPAYPETTGYIIETLLEWDQAARAISCSDWLCQLQRPDGAFPGSVGTSGSPLAFDTGMIVFGMLAAYRHTGYERYANAAKAAAQWLAGSLDADGHWRRNVYVPGYSPAYHSRIVWALLQANQLCNDKWIEQQSMLALRASLEYLRPDRSLNGWGFRPNEAVFTHTLAYALRGWLECSLIIEDKTLLQQVLGFADHLLLLRQQTGSIAGRYSNTWQANKHFICVTGHAQLSCLMSRLYACTNRENYHLGAVQLLQDIAHIPRSGFLPVGVKGAVPGSWPWWGAYQPWRFPNWAAKFYLDAVKMAALNS